jgi:hypothetical protein
MPEDFGLHSRIAGTVQIDGAVAERDVVVIGDSTEGWKVLAEGSSNSAGAFDIDFYGYGGKVVAIAMDKYGDEFEPLRFFNQGDRVHPSSPNGYVFDVTDAGITGDMEPVWNTDGSTYSGSVTFTATPFYRPVASGPLQPEQLGESDPPAPWVLYATQYLPSIIRSRVFVSIPPCRAGDILIAWGLRRGDLDTPSGWTVIPAPPGPDPTGSNQFCYMYYKVADGSESSSVLDVKYIPEQAQRLTLQVVVIRCADNYQITLDHISSVRQPMGAVGATPLSANNVNKKTLMIGVTCWAYSVVTDESESYANIAHPTARQLSYNNKMISDTNNSALSEQLRGIGVAVNSAPLESISIGISSETVNNSESRTDIWVALSTSAIT